MRRSIASSQEGILTSELSKYLAQAYRRDVMGEKIEVEAPELSSKLLVEIKGEVARIDGLRLGAHLANRDFVSYQNRRALMALIDQLTKTEEDRDGST